MQTSEAVPSMGGTFRTRHPQAGGFVLCPKQKPSPACDNPIGWPASVSLLNIRNCN